VSNSATEDLLRRLQQLQTQAAHAESRSGSKLRGARYTGTRELHGQSAAGEVKKFTLFAVSLPKDNGVTDIAFCRTPEVAKLMALLLSLGDELVPIAELALRSVLPQEGTGNTG